jgi:hypothetical protein
MSFFLVRLEPDGNGGMTDIPIPDFGPYEKGSEAAKHAKTLTDSLGYKVQPRRMSQAPDWRARQAERLASGALKVLPEKWDLAPIADHFAHLAASDLSKIAFTENDELGKIDRVTVLTPGRYLTRYYPEVNDADRRRLIAAVDPAGEILFARTREEIADVYINGPSSCMDGKHSFSDMEPFWPTEPYGGGDLALAYVKNAQGRIQSRALCWPDKKVFGRAYGDIQRMIQAMMAEGYTYLRNEKDCYETPFPEGAKILKIPHPTKMNVYVMPYFDDINTVIDKGDHFETSPLSLADLPKGTAYISCGGQSGQSMLYRMCPRIGAGRPAHEFEFVHGVNEEWSRSAIDGHTFICTATKKRYPTDWMIRMATPGILWNREYFKEHGSYCDLTRKAHPKDELVKLGYRTVHQSQAHRLDNKGEELAIEPRRYSNFVDARRRHSDSVDALSYDRPWRTLVPVSREYAMTDEQAPIIQPERYIRWGADLVRDVDRIINLDDVA